MDVKKTELTIQTFGDDVPKPVQNSYEELNLGPITAKIASRFNPEPIQKTVVPIILEGRDLLACATTGSDKALAFLIPIFAKLSLGDKIQVSTDNTDPVTPQCLILVPTRELAFNLLPLAQKLAEMSNLKACAVCGGVPFDTQIAELREGCDVIISTPGRLTDLVERNVVSLAKIKYLCLDEADRIMDLGFEPQIRTLVEQKNMPAQGIRQTLVFSGTLPKYIKRLAQDLLTDFIIVNAGRPMSTNNNINHDVRFVENNNKNAVLMDLLRSLEGRVIVFGLYKRSIDAVDKFLNENGLRSTCIHGDRTQVQREEAISLFSSGEVPILVATDVAARGIHVPQIAHVIMYDMPLTIEDAIFRIGRARPTTVTYFFNEQDKTLAEGLVQLLEDSQQEVPEWLRDYVPKEVHNNFQPRGGASRGRGVRGRGSRGRGYGTGTSTRGVDPYEQHYETQNYDHNEDTGSSNDGNW